MKKAVHLVIIFFWLTMVVLLVYRHAPVPGPGVGAPALLPESSDKWMGIYMKDRKIGYARSKFSREVDGYRAYEEVKMRLKVFGTEQDIHTTTRAVLSPALRVRSFIFTMNAAQDVIIEGSIQDRLLNIRVRTGESESEHSIVIDKAPQMGVTVLPYLIKKGFKTGTRMNIPVFDPATLSTQSMFIEIVGRENITVNGAEVSAFKIRGDLNGLPMLMWVDEQGNELKEESPLGFTLIAEPMTYAMKLPDQPDISDVIFQTAVPFNIDLPGNVSFLKIRIKGVDLEGFDLDGGRQNLKDDIVEIKTEDIEGAGNVSLPVSGMDRFLEDSPFIQSKAPEIIELSQDILDGETNSLNAARKLWLWVYENVEKTPSITLPSALDVLKQKKGDCNEHTTLYTALARSAGLPARINAGLVYRDGYFYYHAWPGVFTGSWIDIDPTLGQFPADASHLRLVRGDLDKQLILMRAINNISLEGIEYK